MKVLNKIVSILRGFLVIFLVFLAVIPVAIFQVLTLFRFRDICSRYIIRPFAYIILRLFQVSYRYHFSEPREYSPKIYLINHHSIIDVPLIPALGLRRTRIFLSKSTYIYIPVTIINYLTGVFYIDEQDQPQKRIEQFKRAEKILKKTGDTVLLSPEGKIVTDGEMAPFNRGAFHMATNLKIPIVPLYIYIDSTLNPGRKFKALNTVVDIYRLPEIDTSKWQMADINKNREMVREIYLAKHAAMHGAASSA